MALTSSLFFFAICPLCCMSCTTAQDRLGLAFTQSWSTQIAYGALLTCEHRGAEYSHKRGFKCTFERGILHLYFNFKRQRYRR